jgi:mono/diheme cytochrome c family protein
VRKWGVVSLLILGLFGLFYYWRRRNEGPVLRGHLLAQRMGCFACHGEGGTHGIPDPGYALGDVPTWNGGLLAMYVDNAGEIKEWVQDGMPARIRKDPGQMKERKGALISMPAFRTYLSDRDASDLAAYVKAVGSYERPDDPKADEGSKTAERVGCFGCHGPEGRGGVLNPRSLKGYIPSWSGGDFPDLARDDGEIREWIENGGVSRLDSNRFARFFLEGQALSMPPYGASLKESEIAGLIDYIHWLRQHPD